MKVSEQQIQRFERISGRVLQVGVWASACVLLVGLLLWAAAPGSLADHVLEAGILVLIATPAARVVVSLVEYLYARDWFFVATAVSVLLVLGMAVWSAMGAR